MRVISGICRGRTLTPPPDRRIRPTSDRVKEALFSIIESRIGSFEHLKILDVCAGTGSLGIEALSRGADTAYFIEISRSASDLIKKNLKLCTFESKAFVVSSDAVAALKTFSAKSISFDIVFFDPPYLSELYEVIPQKLIDSDLIKNNGILAVEHDSKRALPDNFDSCSIIMSRKYGDTKLSVYQINKDLHKC